MRMFSFLICFVVTLVTTNTSTIRAQEIYTHHEIINTTWGDSSHEVGLIKGAEDRLAFGPASLALDEDGAIYILDAVNQRVQKYGNNGIWVFNMPTETAGMDICVGLDKNIYVLYPRCLKKYTIAGKLLAKYQILSDIKLVIGINRNNKGMMSITTGEQKSYTVDPDLRSFNQSGQLMSKTGIFSKFTEGLYITRKVGNYRGIIKNVTTSAEIQVLTSDPLASVVFIDTDRFGHIFVSVETFLSGPSINVNREIRKYGNDGELLATIRLGMNYYTFPRRDVVVDKDGTIYQLQPLKDGVKVLKWQVR